MKNGYKILWTDHALKELQETIEHLQENWTEKELRRLARNLENTVMLLSQNPYLGSAEKHKIFILSCV